MRRLCSMTVLFVSLTATAHAAEPTEAQLEFFQKKIQPLLMEKCHRCHGSEKQKSGLRLDTKDGFLAGGESGPAYNSDTPEESLLLDAVRYGRFQMPPDRKLSDEDIKAVEQWLKTGAAWPDKK
jgi:mono/diheme cytochrome c family protein